MFVILYKVWCRPLLSVTTLGSWRAQALLRPLRHTIQESRAYHLTHTERNDRLEVRPHVEWGQEDYNCDHWPSGAHLSVRENIFKVVQVIDDGSPSGRWGGLCGVLGLQNPQGTFEVVENSSTYYVHYNESEEEKKWAETIDRKYLRILMKHDPDKFLKEMTPNPNHDGVSVGLDLNHPHHQNLHKEFQEDVYRVCIAKGLNHHPALKAVPADTPKIRNLNRSKSSKELYDKEVVLGSKKDAQARNKHATIKKDDPNVTGEQLKLT